MMYPLFVLGLTLVVGVGIAWYILPKLAAVFSQMHATLPLITKYLIGLGGFLGRYGGIVVPLFLIFVALSVYFIFFFPKTKYIGQAMLLFFPGANKLIKEAELARFGYLLSILLSAGLPATEAISSLEKATQFSKYKNFYSYLRRELEEGNSFQKSFVSYPHSGRLIPVPIQHLIASAERSGSLPDTMMKISDTYESKLEITTKDWSTLLEPVLLVIVWLGVVAVALAVILPIYSLIGNLQTSY